MSVHSDRGRRLEQWWQARPSWLQAVLSVLWMLVALGVVIGLVLWVVLTTLLLVTGNT